MERAAQYAEPLKSEREEAQSAECLPCKHEDLSWVPRPVRKKPGAGCHPSAEEEREGCLGLARQSS